jgi:hypothetical protein
MGRFDEALGVIVQLQTLTTELVPHRLPFRKPEHRELLLSGLRLAAGEKT